MQQNKLWLTGVVRRESPGSGVDTTKEIKAMTNTIAPSSIALACSFAAAWPIVAKVSGTSSIARAILQSEGPNHPGAKIVLQHVVRST
jgi:hypothetical protein